MLLTALSPQTINLGKTPEPITTVTHKKAGNGAFCGPTVVYTTHGRRNKNNLEDGRTSQPNLSLITSTILTDTQDIILVLPQPVTTMQIKVKCKIAPMSILHDSVLMHAQPCAPHTTHTYPYNISS